jgi:hypothetical protein
MPVLLRTPEDIFRAEKKDLYVIHDEKEWAGFESLEKVIKGKVSLPAGDWDKSGLDFIKKWIEDKLPGTWMETIGPSEHSGFLAGGPTGLRVDFTAEGLERFVAQWEDGSGKSLDPRFQCYIYPYERWYRRHGRFVPTRARPVGLGKTVWWYTPEGFIHHQLSSEDELALGMEKQSFGVHPANPLDVWMRAVESWPKEFGGLDRGKLTYGYIFWDRLEDSWGGSQVTPWGEPEDALCIPSLEQIRDWFNLPPDMLVREADY